MRNITYLCLFILFPLPFLSLAQSPLYFGDPNCKAGGKPMLLHFGQQVIIQCDSAVIINNYRFGLYEKSREYILNQSPDNQKNLIATYENALQEADQFSREIRTKYDMMSGEMQDMIKSNRSALTQVNNDLEKAKEALATANLKLEESQKKLLHQQKMRGLNRWIFGGMGAATGLLTGAILFR